jgi:hypothetical protein
VSRPTSFRLPDELLARLEEEASSRGTSVSSLVSSVLDEGLKTRRFPGVVYRDGPTGRRAGLLGGPDIWEVIRALEAASGGAEARVRTVSEERGLPVAQVRLAIDFYGEHAEEVDERIALDAKVAERVRKVVERRERLLSA